MKQIAGRVIRLELGKNVPDRRKKHAAHGDDRFLVSPASFDSAVAIPELRVYDEYMPVTLAVKISNIEKIVNVVISPSQFITA